MAERKPLLRIGSDVSEARRGLQQIKDEARDVGRIREEGRVDFRTDAALAKLEQLNTRMERLSQQEPTIAVRLKLGQTQEQIDRLQEKLARLAAESPEVKIKVKVDEAALRLAEAKLARSQRVADRAGGLTGGISAIGAGIPFIGGAFSGLGAISGAASSAASGLAGLVPIGGEATAAVVGLGAAFAAAIPLILGFVAVLGALIASLAAAVAGAAVLGTAFGVALIGPVGIAIAAFSKLFTIFQALGAQDKSAAADGAAVAAATQQRAQAQQQLADAYRNLAQQAQLARQAEQDSAEAVKQDVVNREQAQLNLRKAKQDLKDFAGQSGLGNLSSLFQKLTDVNFKGSIRGALGGATGGTLSNAEEIQLEQLIINIKQAKLAEHDVNVKLQRDRQTEQNYLKNGISAYPGYAAALRQVAAAQDAVHRATLATTKSQAAQAKGLQTLTPDERRLAVVLEGIKNAAERAFSPAVDRALGGIVKGLQILSGILGDKGIQRALHGIGDALHTAFVRVARFFADPATVAAITDFLTAGAKLVRPLTTLFITFGKIVRDVARDALPALIRGVRTFAKEITAWEKHHGGAKKLQGTVNGLIDSFSAWIKIGKGLSLIILAFLRGAKGSGDTFASTLGDVLVKWGRFLNTRKGQQGIIDFFHQLRLIMRDLVIVLDHFVKLLGAIPNAVDKIKKVTSAGGNPVLGPIVKSIIGVATHGFAEGGFVEGPSHPVDSLWRRLTGGEFVLRRQIVEKIGVPALNALNAGMPGPALAGGGAITNIFHINVHSPAGTAPDPMTAAAQIEREMRRRGFAP